MALKYTLAFLLLAFVSIQIASSEDIDGVPQGFIDDLVNKAKAQIAALSKLITDSAAKAEQTLKDLLGKIQQQAADIIAKAKEQVEAQVDKVEKEIADLEAKAKSLGIDISDCVGDNKQLIKQLGLDVIQKVIDCVTEELNQAVKLVTDTIKDIENIKDEVLGLPKNVTKCVKDTHALKCMTKLIATIVKDTTVLPANITKRVAEASKLISSFEADMAQCALKKVFELVKEVTEIGVEVAKCVANKSSEPTIKLL